MKMIFSFSLFVCTTLFSNAQSANNALNFDGVNDFVGISNEQNFDFTGSFTIEAWINVKSFTKQWQAIVTKGDDSWRLHRASTSNGVAFGTTGLSNVDVFGTTNVNDGNWHHVAGVYDGSTKFLYVDGQLDGSTAVAGAIPNSVYPVAIGENLMASGRHFNGNIDEVRIWNVALTQSEIQARMNTRLSGNEVGLVAYFPFNQGVAGGDNTGVTALDDIAANHNNGTLVGFALKSGKSNWVAGVPLCPAPTALKVPSVSDTSAVLKWTLPVNPANGFDIRYHVIGQNPIRKRQVIGNANHIAISDLQPNTTYEWQLRSNCTADSTNWINGPGFTTLASTGSLNATSSIVQILPNPNNGDFMVQIQLPHKAAPTIFELYNNSGSKVWQQNSGMLSGRISRNINAGNKLLPGIYRLIIRNGDTQLMQKVIVTK